MTIPEAFNLGVQHQQAGRLAEAEAIYRQILAEQPNHPDALYMMGVLAQNVGKGQLAMQLVGEAIRVGPARAEFFGTLGELLEHGGRYDEALAAYQNALALNNKMAAMHNNLGNVLVLKNQHEAAVAHFKQAMAIQPDLAIVPFNLARAYSDMGRVTEAIALYRQAMTLRPNFLEAMHSLGRLLVVVEGNDSAIMQYKEALAAAEALPAAEKKTPARIQSVARILVSLGDSLTENGQFEEAIPFFERAVALAPDQSKALSNFSVCLLQMKRYEETVAVCNTQLRHYPNVPHLYYNLGGALCHLGRREEGRAAFLRAVALTTAAEDRVKVALAMQVTGLYDEAIECFRGMAAKGTRSLDQSVYWGLRETSLTRAGSIAGESRKSGEAAAKLPYLGDKVVLLRCDRAVREQLRAAGMHGGYSIDPLDGMEIWLSAQLAAGPDAGKLADVIEQWLEWVRNEAAMAGTICTVWMPDMPQRVADAVRRAAAGDLIEISGGSAEEVFAQLAARAVVPADTEGKCFAVVSIRNGGLELLPHWLEHYTQMGVDEILLGIFDDLTGDAAAEIERCAARWRFRRFAQHWGGATESETYCQRQTGCRLAGARPGTWILHTDLDELQQYPGPLKEVTAAAGRLDIGAIFGRLIDRVAADGSLPAIQPTPSLWEQFPVECNMTQGILKGYPGKVMMTRFSVIVNSGHHDAPQERANAAPIGRVAHFKWHAGLLERMRWGLQQENASLEWKADTRRFLGWLERHGGRIDLSDPELVRSKQP